jgi:hypothetical protein
VINLPILFKYLKHFLNKTLLKISCLIYDLLLVEKQEEKLLCCQFVSEGELGTFFVLSGGI